MAYLMNAVGGNVQDALSHLSPLSSFDPSHLVILPGFCDVHVHLREPGFSYKETMESGTRAAARGGYTAVCTMPNLNPVPDSVPHMQLQLDRIRDGACVGVYPLGAITVGQEGKTPADLAGLAPYVVAFSDDGRGVQDPDTMRRAMLLAKALDRPIVAHCEDNRLLHGGYIHQGAYAAAHGHRGIPSESEWGQLARDIELARETGVKYHVCHVSCRESVDLIRRAKADGVDITCETAPHYLVLDEGCLREDGRFKMNPPLRGAEDREALIAGLLDGTVDMIATDHAPHSAEEKARGLAGSAFGIVGLETAFPVLYTHLVKTGILSWERLLDALVWAPRRRFGIPLSAGDFSVWEVHTPYTVDPAAFESLGRATPFAGMQVRGTCLATFANGKPVYVNTHPFNG